jgi:hypothetical protein
MLNIVVLIVTGRFQKVKWSFLTLVLADPFRLPKITTFLLTCIQCPEEDIACLTLIKMTATRFFGTGGFLTHWHTQPAVRQAEPSMPLLLILALCQ